MAAIVYDANKLRPGEPCFLLYVDKPGNSDVVAECDMAAIAPISLAMLEPRRLTGFELPAQEALTKARQRAVERGVEKILIVDPLGWLSFATTNRYG